MSAHKLFHYAIEANRRKTAYQTSLTKYDAHRLVGVLYTGYLVLSRHYPGQPDVNLEPMSFHILPSPHPSAILPPTAATETRPTMADTADQHGAPGAEGLLALIERHLPALWQAHAHSGSRALCRRRGGRADRECRTAG